MRKMDKDRPDVICTTSIKTAAKYAAFFMQAYGQRAFAFLNFLLNIFSLTKSKAGIVK